LASGGVLRIVELDLDEREPGFSQSVDAVKSLVAKMNELVA
jgi:hypothetical protein